MKKKFVTLLEIMIVIFLISIIGGVVGYNMKGSLDKGKKFKSEQAREQINNILQLELSKGNMKMDEVAQNAEEILRESGLVKNPDELLKDGWGERFTIVPNDQTEEFDIYSKKCPLKKE